MHSLRQKGRGGGRSAADNEGVSADCLLFIVPGPENAARSCPLLQGLAPRSPLCCTRYHQGHLTLVPRAPNASLSRPSLTVSSLFSRLAPSRPRYPKPRSPGSGAPGAARRDVVRTAVLTKCLHAGSLAHWLLATGRAAAEGMNPGRSRHLPRATAPRWTPSRVLRRTVPTLSRRGTRLRSLRAAPAVRMPWAPPYW